MITRYGEAFWVGMIVGSVLIGTGISGLLFGASAPMMVFMAGCVILVVVLRESRRKEG